PARLRPAARTRRSGARAGAGGPAVLLRPVALRNLGLRLRSRLGLVAVQRRRRLASLSARPLGPDRLRLDLGLGRGVRLGGLPLRPLAQRRSLRLGLGPRNRL